jgi:hypothetical protein
LLILRSSLELLLQFFVRRWVIRKLGLLIGGAPWPGSSRGAATDIDIVQKRVISLVVSFVLLAIRMKCVISWLGVRGRICACVLVGLGVREIIVLLISFFYTG